MIHIIFRGVLPGLDDTGISKHHTVAGYIAVYITIGSDQHIIADGDISHHRCVDTDPDTVADFGSALSPAPVLLADGNAFVKIAVFSDFSTHVHRNVKRMSKIQSLADFGAERHFNAVLSFDSVKQISVINTQQRIFTALGFPQIPVKFLCKRTCMITVSVHIRLI